MCGEVGKANRQQVIIKSAVDTEGEELEVGSF